MFWSTTWGYHTACIGKWHLNGNDREDIYFRIVKEIFGELS